LAGLKAFAGLSILLKAFAGLKASLYGLNRALIGLKAFAGVKAFADAEALRPSQMLYFNMTYMCSRVQVCVFETDSSKGRVGDGGAGRGRGGFSFPE